MAITTKRLFASRPSATTDTELYEVGAGDGATLNMSICNTGADTTFRLALTAGSAPASGEYVFYDLPIAANETRQITGICLTAGQAVWVYSGAATIDYVGTGIEETA
jgi:hypothetical protein